MNRAKENSNFCNESVENESCLADSDFLNASIFAPLEIPNFKQPNTPTVQSNSQKLQHRITELETQVEQLKANDGLSLLKIKSLEDELICRENELARAQQENISLRSELNLIKKQNKPFAASQYDLQKNKNETHKTNFSVSRDTQLKVFRSNQRSSRLDSLPKNSVSTFNNNTNSVTSLSTQYQFQGLPPPPPIFFLP
uniref:Uncharacterized protein n=1 Tax=Meloidogyne incognita TaxID=6306 RepID=A0A914L4X3_MELIC